MTDDAMLMFRRAAGWFGGTEIPVRPLPASYEVPLVDSPDVRAERGPTGALFELDLAGPGASRDVAVYWAPGAVFVEIPNTPQGPLAIRLDVGGSHDGALARARVGFGIVTIKVPFRTSPADRPELPSDRVVAHCGAAAA